jgi:hypothetical protein
MAEAKTSLGAKVALAVIVIPLLIGAWFAAPLVLPMWRWQHLDKGNGWAKAAQEGGETESVVKTEFECIVRHAPRGKGDPTPWQIVKSMPDWYDLNPDKHDDEQRVLVRAAMISEKDGTPFSDLWVGAARDEKYFKIKAWRLPPKTFGLGHGRPVLVYSQFTRLSIGEGQGLNGTISGYANTDADIDDGYVPPSNTPSEADNP